MATEQARLDLKTTGLAEFKGVGMAITGINQGLEIAKKLWDAVSQAAAGALRVTKQFIGTASEFENYNVQWVTLLGSVDAAEKRMKSLFTFATRTPFKLPEVINAAKTMEAFGIYSEQALTAVGDMASAFGKTFEETALAVAGAATGEMERLKVFGITSATVMAQTGEKINRSTVEGQKKVVDAVITIFEDRAGGGMERMIKTFSGMMSMFSDKWLAFKKLVTDAGFFDNVRAVFGTILESVERLFSSGQVESVAASIGKTMSTLFLKTVDTMLVIAIKVAELVDQVTTWMAENDPAGKAEKITKGWRDFWSWVPFKSTEERREQEFQDYAPAFGSARYMAAQRGSDNPFIAEMEKLRETIQNLVDAAGYTPMGPNIPAGFYESGRGAVEPGSFFSSLAGPRGGAMPGFAAPADEDEDYSQKQADNWLETVRDTTEAAGEMWGVYYGELYKKGQEWKSLSDITLKGVLSASKTATRQLLADFIKRKTSEAVIEQGGQLAKALAAAAKRDFWGAAKHTAAAVAFGAIGGIAAGMIAPGPESAPVEVTNADAFGGGSDGEGGTRRVSQTTTVRAQQLTVNVNFISGVLIAGDDGMERFISDTLFPAINDGIQMGEISVA